MSYDDAMRNVEDRKGQQDLGVFAYRIFEGARMEGASRFEATLLIAAWFYGMFLNTNNPPDNDDL